jgi:hypothetical protein
MTAAKRRRREHGTEAGYQQHVAAKDRTCDACKDAHSAYMRDYRAQASPMDPDRKIQVSYRLLSLLAANVSDEVRAEVERELGAVRTQRLEELRSA